MPRYDAFLSYSHAADGVFGPRLQTLLEGFARTGPRRALRVFRDEQNLAADPDLWGSIEQALTQSTWFVLLASPEAAGSSWVDKEVAWWLEHRSVDRLVIALTERDPAGPVRDGVPLPPALLVPGAPRPAVVDLTETARSAEPDRQDPLVQRTVAELAAIIHERSAAELIAADAAHRRRARSRTIGSAALLALMVVVVLVGGLLARAQTTRADDEARVATAHLLAATALARSATDLEQATLLAVEAYRLHPDTQTLTALLRSVSGSRPVDARAVLDDEVVVAAAAPRSGAVVLGTATGEILRWDLRSPPVRLTSLDARPNALATSLDASVVAVATEGPDAAVWVHADDRRRKVQEGPATDVAVSPSGERFAVLRWQAAEHDVSVRATADDTVVADADLADTDHDSVRLQDDAVVLHQRRTNQGLGPWQRRSLPDLAVLDSGTVLDDDLAEDVDGATVTAQAVTTDGSWVMSHLDDTVHATRTADGAAVSAPVPTALGTFPPAVMALSPGARHVLLSRRDEVWVVQLPVAGRKYRAERLHGIGTPDGAVFVDDDLLVMNHGSTLTAWDVGSSDALAETAVHTTRTPQDRALTADGTAVLSAGPDPEAADRVLATAHTFDTARGTTDTDADTGDRRVAEPGVARADLRRLGSRSVPAGTSGARLLPVPLADGTPLFVDTRTGAVLEAAGAHTGTLEPRYETGVEGILDATVDSAGRVVLAAGDGTVHVSDPLTGRVVHEAGTPPQSGTETRGATISPEGDLVAFHDVRPSDHRARSAFVRVVEVSTATVRTQHLTTGRLTSRGNEQTWQQTVAFAFGREYLAVAHAGGVAVLDRDGGSVRREIAAPASGRQNAVAPVPGTTLVAVAGDADWIRLFDTTTGEEVGDLSALARAVDGDSPLWLAAGETALWAVGPRYTTRWDLRPARLHTQACEFAARDLTADEWREVTGAAPPADLGCDRPLAAP